MTLHYDLIWHGCIYRMVMPRQPRAICVTRCAWVSMMHALPQISCAACYKSKDGYTKPLEQVKQEVDLAVSLRNLNLVTLAGGESLQEPARRVAGPLPAGGAVTLRWLVRGGKADDITVTATAPSLGTVIVKGGQR